MNILLTSKSSTLAISFLNLQYKPLSLRNIPSKFLQKKNIPMKFFSSGSTPITQQKMEKERYFQEEDKTGLLITLEDTPGILANLTEIFAKNKINLTYINSKPSKFLNVSCEKRLIDFFVDFEGKMDDSHINKAIAEIKEKALSVIYHETEQVPWFPKSINDLNSMGRKLLTANEELASDHPGFNDETYRKRREEIVHISNSYNIQDCENIPIVNYTEEEKRVWKLMWEKLIPLQRKHACDEVLENMDIFIKDVGFRSDEIPQIKDVSNYLRKKTNTIFRPVGGLLSQREFLNGLAFRVFHSTQYLRHHSKPLYTPEPDIVHEILGHAILFANKDFADFSQEIGLASLAASDEDIKKIGTIYWFTIEFGLCLQNKQKKIYGAGILSSPSEIEWSISEKPKLHDFDLEKIANYPFSITDIQQNYFLAPSFVEMKKQVMRYSDNIKKPFNLTYNVENKCMEIDRKIKTRKEFF